MIRQSGCGNIDPTAGHFDLFSSLLSCFTKCMYFVYSSVSIYQTFTRFIGQCPVLFPHHHTTDMPFLVITIVNVNRVSYNGGYPLKLQAKFISTCNNILTTSLQKPPEAISESTKLNISWRGEHIPRPPTPRSSVFHMIEAVPSLTKNPV